MSVVVAGQPLGEDAHFTPLFRAWLRGEGPAVGAASQWRAFLGSAGPTPAPAPAFATAAWREPWLAQLQADLPDDDSRQRAAAQAARLAAGEAQVVVTGQQPGFLGGPLYTLYKAAAAVAAAAARTAAGHPTYPLFWFGDDDDDRVEAFAPWLWDPTRRAFLRGVSPAGPADRMVGAAPATEWAQGEAAWLREQGARGGLAADLAQLWARGREEGLNWGRLQRRALLRLFAGQGLLAVSGNDPRLHAAAASFYAQLMARRAELAEAARAAGERLAESGFHAQLGAASLESPFHSEAADRRLRLAGSAAMDVAGVDPSRLRPGVMLRSPVQDWLFRPAAVVVGPGEFAYLVQLQTVYEHLGLARAPLLPRLFAQIAPARQAGALAGDGSRARIEPDWDAAAAPLAEAAAAALARALGRHGVEMPRAADAAAREAARWRVTVARLLAREAARGDEASGADPAPWVSPPAQQQERALAMHWATAVWGESLVVATLAAAGLHFAHGARGPWRQFILTVPDDA